MEALVLLFGIITGDVDRLGVDDFDTREAATERLGKWGLFAWPFLWQRYTETSDAEILYRIKKAAGVDFNEIGREMKVRLALYSAYEPLDVKAFWDEGTRKEVHVRIMSWGYDSEYASGHPNEWKSYALWRINPAHDGIARCDDCQKPTVEECCQRAIRRYRAMCGIYPQAPAPRGK
jgi:hypothetical protein